MTYIIDIQHIYEDQNNDLPDDKFIESVITTTLIKFRSNAELSIRIVDNQEIAALNKAYRHKDGPTNVLSFPVDLPAGVDLEYDLLGDIVIAADIVKHEALQQNKTFISHFTHMLVHGTLHLLGFDHINDSDARIMENHEIIIMKELNFPTPYLNTHTC